MLTARAFGKINLTLEITARREDGYHELATVMQSVSLADTVMLEACEEGPCVCCDGGIPADETNTAFRAVEAFAAFCGNPDFRRVKITVEKRIPNQAGMGGGSADAAAALILLNRHFGTDLPKETLCAIGKTIGADVPFCIVGGTQRCTGIGEILSPLTPLPRCLIVLCKPPKGISTREAFAHADSGEYADGEATRQMEAALAERSLKKIGDGLQNDFERLVPLEEVERIRTVLLENGALGSRMTGSGSVVYGIFDSPDAAVEAAQALRKEGKVFLVAPSPCGVDVIDG